MTHVKTAVSLPEEVFAALAKIADETGKSRSAIVAEAVEALARRRKSAERREQFNRMSDAQAHPDAETGIADSRSRIARHSRLLDELGYVRED
jgi:metal-responsive CopG/Arc/MetJ family transcriptional regulator